jgi:hypothetical protein
VTITERPGVAVNNLVQYSIDTVHGNLVQLPWSPDAVAMVVTSLVLLS